MSNEWTWRDSVGEVLQCFGFCMLGSLFLPMWVVALPMGELFQSLFDNHADPNWWANQAHLTLLFLGICNALGALVLFTAFWISVLRGNS